MIILKGTKFRHLLEELQHTRTSHIHFDVRCTCVRLMSLWIAGTTPMVFRRCKGGVFDLHDVARDGES